MALPFDFDVAVQNPFRMQPGLRRLAEGSKQLTPLKPGSRHQREKLAVLFAMHQEAMVASPGFDAGPALDALCEQAQREHPEHFAWDGACAQALALGVAVQGDQVKSISQGVFGLGDEVPRCIAALPAPWRRTGLLTLAFAEDFAIVDGKLGTVPWMAVALPSRWAPREKIGRHFTEIHAPVADSQTLLRAGDSLMRLVCGDERWERFVWNVTAHPRLNAHPATLADATWPADAFARDIEPLAWFRHERQTFIPVPKQTQAVFTIVVDCVALPALINSAARATALRDAVGSMSPAVLQYRGLTGVQGPLLAWLDRRAQA